MFASKKAVRVTFLILCLVFIMTIFLQIGTALAGNDQTSAGFKDALNDLGITIDTQQRDVKTSVQNFMKKTVLPTVQVICVGIVIIALGIFGVRYLMTGNDPRARSEFMKELGFKLIVIAVIFGAGFLISLVYSLVSNWWSQNSSSSSMITPLIMWYFG